MSSRNILASLVPPDSRLEEDRYCNPRRGRQTAVPHDKTRVRYLTYRYLCGSLCMTYLRASLILHLDEVDRFQFHSWEPQTGAEEK